MEHEELFGQLGLILTQLRFTRRALEDVERSTARYHGLAFASALQRGPHFSEPPLFGGALKVYVVNINDLAPGGGFGGFMEGLLGGIGRFFGGFFGGLAGGVVSGVSLPVMLGQVERIARLINSILERVLGRFPAKALETAAAPPSTAPPPPPAPPTDLAKMLGDLKDTVNAFTALFQAASTGPAGTGPATAAGTSAAASTAAGRNWLQMLEVTRGVLQGISHVIDSLIVLVPMLLGTLAVLISRLDDIKLALVGVLQFALQNVLLLRGVVLATVFDTVSSAARLGATVLGILATAVDRILASAFNIIGVLLDTAIEAFLFVSTGLKNTVDALLNWATTTLFAVLTTLGDTLVFRVFIHLVQLLPAVIPPLYEMIESVRLSPTERGALAIAASRTILPPAFPGTPSGAIPAFPNPAALLTPPGNLIALRTTFTDASREISTQVGSILGATQGALSDFGKAMDTTAARGEARFSEQLNGKLAALSAHSATLAETLTPEAAPGNPATGLEAIAQAYEGWLTSGGLDRLLGTITDHFRRTPTTAEGTLPSRITEAAATERPRATIDIQDVVIEVAPPTEAAAAPPEAAPAPPPLSDEQILGAVLRAIHDLEERGVTFDPDALLAQLPA